MDNRYIGVFDSGLGGLTAVKQIMECLPEERIIYFGDTGRVPYGTRGRDTIIKYVRGDIRFLLGFDVKMIVVACGTASSVAIPVLKSEFDIPVMGVLEATADKALRSTKNKRIGVIGTSGTIKSGAYERLIHSCDSEIRTYSQACPLFVPLVENGHSDTEVTRLVVREYLSGIREQGVDTLILGCTHYPHLKKAIGEFMGDDVVLVDPGKEAAVCLKKYLAEKDMLAAEGGTEDKYRYYVSDNTEGFAELAGMFLKRSINEQVTQIDIEKY